MRVRDTGGTALKSFMPKAGYTLRAVSRLASNFAQMVVGSLGVGAEAGGVLLVEQELVEQIGRAHV